MQKSDLIFVAAQSDDSYLIADFTTRCVSNYNFIFHADAHGQCECAKRLHTGAQSVRAERVWAVFQAQLASGVKLVVGNDAQFAAVKGDGTVVTWGPPNSGGDCSAVQEQFAT